MSEPIVDARDLVKRYGAHAAVDGITGPHRLRRLR